MRYTLYNLRECYGNNLLDDTKVVKVTKRYRLERIAHDYDLVYWNRKRTGFIGFKRLNDDTGVTRKDYCYFKKGARHEG